MGSLHFLTLLLKLGIERGQILPKVVQRAFEERLGNEEFLLHILLIHLVACLTGKDDEFPHHILTAQVDARVGFAVALFLGQTHGLAERHIGRNLVEDEVQRAAQHRLQFQNLVARIDEVIDGVDNRQTRTYIRLEEVLHPTFPRCRLQLRIVIVVARCSHLVGSHHRDVVAQQILIQPCHFGTCRAIDKHAVENVHANHFFLQALDVAGWCLLQHLTQPLDGKLAAWSLPLLGGQEGGF